MDADEDMRRLLETDVPVLDAVIACVFGTQVRDVPPYPTLLDRPGSTVEELADALDRDRSNVNRSLSRLLELELAERNRRLLDPGGYVYQYTATPLPETKERLHGALDRWVDHVHERIDAFEEQQPLGE